MTKRLRYKTTLQCEIQDIMTNGNNVRYCDQRKLYQILMTNGIMSKIYFHKQTISINFGYKMDYFFYIQMQDQKISPDNDRNHLFIF
jgi:hypothetical protein